MSKDQKPVPLLNTAARAACPKCAQGPIFEGLLTIRPKCTACGLNYDFEDVGDGPTVFVIMVLNLIVFGSALYAEFTLGFPLWAHIIVWPIVIVLLTIWGLRFTKAALIIKQYQTDARQGDIASKKEKK